MPHAQTIFNAIFLECNAREKPFQCLAIFIFDLGVQILDDFCQKFNCIVLQVYFQDRYDYIFRSIKIINLSRMVLDLKIMNKSYLKSICVEVTYLNR